MYYNNLPPPWRDNGNPSPIQGRVLPYRPLAAQIWSIAWKPRCRNIEYRFLPSISCSCIQLLGLSYVDQQWNIKGQKRKSLHDNLIIAMAFEELWIYNGPVLHLHIWTPLQIEGKMLYR
jgi:hypothetical protein